MREATMKIERAEAAVEVAIVPGLPASIDAVAERADPRHAFLRRAWFAAARPAAPATVVASRSDGAIIAALPLGAIGPRRLGLRAVPGCYWPYRSFPVAADAGDAELAALLSHAAARRALGPAWRLGPVYADDPTAGRIAALADRAGWTPLQRRIATAFSFDMAAQREAGAWPRTSTLKKNRFFEKHLARSGPLGFRFVSGRDWTPEVFDQLAAIEAKSWIPRETGAGDAKFLAARHRRFWEEAARDPVLAEMLHAAILTIGERPAAFAFDLDAGTLKYAVANSYDEEFAKHSPGRVLAYRSLPAAAERGIERVDWGAGDSGYKRTLGAVAGPEIVDFLFVRNRALAAVLRPLWIRSGRR
ncbi:MAG TPA: GNAT family N-acetyltransferase [Allosphingosinicella sp.]|nr:GNAT family N-acetyltransferase [Allosphingosinicella sp.]